MILLFESNATEFDTNGLGTLPDATYCVVTEERNGEYELEMDYPVEGLRYSQLALRRIILAKPNTYSQLQPFRIYSISKPINGIVTINAEHISYDLSGYSVKPFSASTCALALQGLKTNSVVTCPFTFWTDKSVRSDFDVIVPSSIRSLLGGSEGSILDVYGKADYEFDLFQVKLHQNRGTDHGMIIRYGKNLTDLRQEENCSNVYTHVYPFWYTEEEGLVQLSGYTVKCPGTYNYTRILPLDCSNDFQEKPTTAQLLSRANEYISNNDLGIPDVNLTVSFVQLSQTEEYKNLKMLEEVRLCDTVTVEFPKLGVSAKSKCIKTVYNVLAGKYDSIELGETQRSTLSSTIAESVKKQEEIPTKSELQLASEKATKMILGGMGGYAMLHSSSGDVLNPDEILIMDKPTITEATKVWRWNKNGLGFSNSGYSGPYSLAMTADGAIVADRITTGELNGALIKANSISSDAISLTYKNDVKGQIKSAIDGIEIDARAIRMKADTLTWDSNNSSLTEDGVLTFEKKNAASNRYYKNRITNYGFYLSYNNNPSYGMQITPCWSTDNGPVGTGIGCISGLYLFAGNVGGGVAFRFCGNEPNNPSYEAPFWFLLGAYFRTNLTVKGTKNRVVSTESYGERLLSAYETPSPMFGDIGEGSLDQNGECRIYLDPVFSQTIMTDHYQVFLQKNGPGDIYVSERTKSYFVVKGTPSLQFSWEIKGKQIDYSQNRLEVFNRLPYMPEAPYAGNAIQHISDIKEERNLS